MRSANSHIKKSNRLDIRLSAEEKELILKAHTLSGTSTFTAFILESLKSKAEEIIKNKETILATQRDKEIFFAAIFSDKDEQPNKALRTAAKNYKNFVKKFNIKED